MSSRLVVIFAVLVAALGLTACGSDGGSGSTDVSSPVEAVTEPSATDQRIEKIEEETKEAELEAALARKEAAQQAAKARKVEARQAAARAQAANVAEEEEGSAPESSGPPTVIGMRLPEAESTLKAAGFRSQAENTDTAFGIVVRSHYTVCTQSEPHGSVVTVLAQKYGC